jgi:transposase
VPIDAKSLPEDPVILKQMLIDVTAQLDKTNKLLRQLLEAKHHTKSEQLNPDQLKLFVDELKRTKGVSKDDELPPPPDADASDGKENSRPRGRQPIAPHLKRQRVEHDLAEEEKHCADCNQDLHPFGEETSERYEYIPAQFLVIEDVCKKYACECTVKTATKPPQPIAKSAAGASLLAQVIVSKIADHLPLYRQGKIFSRFGVDISDQTMGGWLRQAAVILEPLYDLLGAYVLSSKVVGTDDTPVRVLDKSLPKTTRKGRFWPYVGDRDHPGVVFDYTPTRGRAGPVQFLEKYRGYLQADAYVAYDSFFTDPERGLVEVACWAHTRRHFLEALENDSARMGVVLAYIGKLYGVEKAARQSGITGEDLRLLRQQAAVPLLAELHGYLRRIGEDLLPKSAAGQAVSYALTNWPALTRYCEDGALSIDNNHTERTLRGIAVGRRNWLFVGSDQGGRTMAILRSFVGSCELVKVDPFEWFRDVLARIGEHSMQALEELLPHRWAAARAL